MRKLPDWALTPLQLARKKKRIHDGNVRGAIRAAATRGRNRRALERKKAAEPYTVYGTLPGEREILVDIMRLHADGLPSFFIADWLNCRKKPARGQAWYETSVKRIVERGV